MTQVGKLTTTTGARYLDKEDATRRSGPPAMGMSFPSLGSPSLQKEGHYTCSIDPTELWLEHGDSGVPA